MASEGGEGVDDGSRPYSCLFSLTVWQVVLMLKAEGAWARMRSMYYVGTIAFEFLNGHDSFQCYFVLITKKYLLLARQKITHYRPLSWPPLRWFEGKGYKIVLQLLSKVNSIYHMLDSNGGDDDDAHTPLLHPALLLLRPEHYQIAKRVTKLFFTNECIMAMFFSYLKRFWA